MAEFEIGLNGAQQQAAALISAVHGLGKALDSAEFKSKGLATEVARAMTAMEHVQNRLHQSLTKTGDQTAEVNKALDHAKVIAQNVFASIAAANLKATVQAQAYTGQLAEMQRVLTDTASKSNYVKYQQKIALLTTDLTNQNKYLQASFAALQTEEGKANANLKVRESGLRSLITSEERLINTHTSLQQASTLLDTALGRETANLRAQNSAKEQLITLDTRIAAAAEARRAVLASLSTEMGKEAAVLAVQEQSKRALVTADARLAASTANYQSTLISLDTNLGKANAELKAQVKAKEQMVTFDTRLNSSTSALGQQIGAMGTEAGKVNAILQAKLRGERDLVTADQALENSTRLARVQLEQLGTAKGHDNVLTQATLNNRKAEIAENSNLAARLAALHRARESLNGGIREEIALAEQANRARIAEITEVGRQRSAKEALEREIKSLNGGLQEEIVKLTAVRNARKQSITESVTEKKVVDEMTAAIKRQENQLTRLQAQAMVLSSSHGPRMAQLRKEIVEQERYNRILSMSTAELLGFSGAQQKAALSQAIGSQSAAMLRAGLQGAQTSIGMYTSATILAATATYALSAAIRSTISTGAEFTATMARTDAIMSTSGPSWMGENTRSMEAMESQVRALGQSTIYTASEVAQGLSELGMAGLSSGDAVIALSPALALATIANVSMARSADIATNTMMTFGMGAKDLGNIVDIMATAVNNSNTDIEQLANALSYAGPAAQTAGISFKDTTAAIEALSNSGFKGSRAGSALRRLFVSILNPTKKGSEVIKKYSLDILDAEGNTRSLTDIVGQLNDKLGNLSGGERLGAIQNLVGVYATSAVSALVDQSSNLERLRRQLDDTAGAAEKMQKKIADSLQFDWKSVISAYEEVQLSAFDSVEYRLREASAGLSKWLIELTQPVATSQGETYEEALKRQKVAAEQLIDAQNRLAQAREYGNAESIKRAQADVDAARQNANLQSITELDRILVKAENAASALGKIVLGVLAFKFASGNVAGALAEDTKRLAQRLGEAASRAGTMAESMRTVTLTSGSASTAMRTQAVMSSAAATGLQTVGTSAQWASAKLSMLAGAAAGVMRFLGWAGLLAGIGFAIYDAFDNDVDKQILDQKDSVDDLKGSYEALKAEVDSYALARTRAALEVQVDADQKNLTSIQNRKGRYTEALAAAEKNNLPTQAIKDELSNLAAMQEQYTTKINNTKDALSKLGTTQLDVARSSDAQVAANAKVAAKIEELEAATKNLAASSRNGINNLNGQTLISRLTDELKALREEAKLAAAAAEDAKVRLVDLAAIEATASATRTENGNDTVYTERLSEAGKLYEAEKLMNDEKARMAELVARAATANNNYANAVKAGDGALAAAMAAARPGEGIYNDLAAALDKATESYYKLLAASNTSVNLYNAKEALADFYRTDAEKLAMAKQALANNLAEDGAVPRASKELNEEAEAERLKERLRLLQLIKGIEKKDEKAGDKASKAGESAAAKLQKEAEAELKAAQSTYDGLAKKIDPVTASLRDLEKGTAAMKLLMEAGRITTQQYGLAMNELNLAHYRAVQAQDKNYQAAEKLKEAYADTTFSKASTDLAEMRRQLDNGTISLDRYVQMYDVLQKKQKENVLSGLPTASTLTAGSQGMSTPFSEVIDKANEIGQGRKQYSDRSKELDTDFKLSLQNQDDETLKLIQEQNAKKEADAALHAAAMQEIAQKDFQNRKTLQEQYNRDSKTLYDSQKEYAEASGLMIAGAMAGSLSNVFGMIAATGEDATAAQKAAFVAQKALAIAQILLFTHVAAARAPAEAGTFLGMTLSTAIMAQGYASAGLVAALSIGELVGGGKSSGGGGGSPAMYDTGGFIPYNRTGIVGEYGPELVSGPAHVRGRGATSGSMGGESGGGTTYRITLAPQIHVENSGSGASEQDGRKFADGIKGVVVSTLQQAIRPNGMLDTWIRTVK